MYANKLYLFFFFSNKFWFSLSRKPLIKLYEMQEMNRFSGLELEILYSWVLLSTECDLNNLTLFYFYLQ